MQRGQAEVLVPMVQQVLAQADTDFPSIDMIAVTIGPGAFTGLRIGLSTAQAFGLALDKPVVGVTTLDVLAARFFAENTLDDSQLLCVLIETKRQDYYCQFFRADGSVHMPPQALSAESLEGARNNPDIRYIGDAIERFENEGGALAGETIAGYDLPHPETIAVLAQRQYEEEGPKAPEPLYLRGADVSQPKKEQRVIVEN